MFKKSLDFTWKIILVPFLDNANSFGNVSRSNSRFLDAFYDYEKGQTHRENKESN